MLVWELRSMGHVFKLKKLGYTDLEVRRKRDQLHQMGNDLQQVDHAIKIEEIIQAGHTIRL